MTENERYLFDINGYIVVPEVLSIKEVSEANRAIDKHSDEIQERTGDLSLSGVSSTLKGIAGRGDVGGMLTWEKPWCDPFRAMLIHPRVAPYLQALLGLGFRMDHKPNLITMREGTEGHVFHGSSGPEFDPRQYYIVRNGRMHNGLMVAAWQLADQDEGDGGLCVIPGSHKGNFACPEEIRNFEAYHEFIKQITAKAGDVVIFSEATTHGTLPWRAKHERRSLLFRYSPSCLAYSSSYLSWPEGTLDGLTSEQRAILEPPYHKEFRENEYNIPQTRDRRMVDYGEAPTKE
ncbi:MAG: hypothetical protein DF168_02171 [Candidatus Moanabacter tarae]|uniref:Phytanoyl-CoA dioxygenase family protein n=1 Tax=Candidatus Moanibacter tarae TaxID=2200854 RepID=A0A2Z4AI35_9BACT|nr:MAG: hypothetical protein DF168_02171 [Candidatus Moanabacter tarae]|tara:strand:+ start:426 stop:1295 length:870 start_codon:yes stop_codon:yes gene_type:complete